MVSQKSIKMNKSNHYSSVLKIINVYQTLIWIVALFYFFKLLYVSLFVKISFALSFLLLLLILLSIVVIYSNFCLFFNLSNARRKKFLVLNLWINFLQIFQLGLLGINYAFVLGIYFIVGYSFDQTQNFYSSFNLFKTSIAFNYLQSDIIRCQINLIPLIIFIVFNISIKKEVLVKAQGTKID